VRWLSAWATLCGPSTIVDSPSSGSGGTRLDQTSMDSGRLSPLARTMTFPSAHAAAAPIVKSIPVNATLPPVSPLASRPMPAVATTAPAA
jgi:hypothetical protein